MLEQIRPLALGLAFAAEVGYIIWGFTRNRPFAPRVQTVAEAMIAVAWLLAGAAVIAGLEGAWGDAPVFVLLAGQFATFARRELHKESATVAAMSQARGMVGPTEPTRAGA